VEFKQSSGLMGQRKHGTVERAGIAVGYQRGNCIENRAPETCMVPKNSVVQ